MKVLESCDIGLLRNEDKLIDLERALTVPSGLTAEHFVKRLCESWHSA